MIYFAQLIRMINKMQGEATFLALFDDLRDDIEDLGYQGIESDLVDDFLMNHFGIEIEDQYQLNEITKVILENQGKLKKKVEIVSILFKIGA